VAPKSQSITRFDCHAAVCLPYAPLRNSRSDWWNLD